MPLVACFCGGRDLVEMDCKEAMLSLGSRPRTAFQVVEVDLCLKRSWNGSSNEGDELVPLLWFYIQFSWSEKLDYSRGREREQW